MKDPIIYNGEGPVYSTSIAPAYYPMGVSYSRRYPVIPDATSRGMSSMHAALPIPRPAVLMPRRVGTVAGAAPGMMAVPQVAPSQYMFYEDRDEAEYGTLGGDTYGRQGQVFHRGGPQMYQTKTAYFQ